MADAITPAAEPSFREQVAAAEAQDNPPEQPVEQEAQTETPQDEGDGVEKVKEEKVVPLAALHQARQAEKDLKRQLREQAQQMQAFQQQQVEMMQYLQRQGQPQPQVPDKEQDVLGYTAAGVEHLAQKFNNLEQQQYRDQQATYQQQQLQAFVGAVRQHEAAFVAQAPDYSEAIQWAKDKKQAEYEAIGMPTAYAKARLEQEVFQLAHMAFENGESPAEVAYRMAKTMGYRNRTVTPAQKLEMQRNGQAASIPSGAGATGGGLSLDALSKLSGEDFLKATAGNKWRQTMSK